MKASLDLASFTSHMGNLEQKQANKQNLKKKKQKNLILSQNLDKVPIKKINKKIIYGISDDDGVWRKKIKGKSMRGPGTSYRIVVQL